MTQSFSLYEDLTIEENLVLRRAALPSRRPRRQVVARDARRARPDLAAPPVRRHAVGRLETAPRARRLHHASAEAAAARRADRRRRSQGAARILGRDPSPRRRRAHRAGLDPLHGRGGALPSHQLHLLRQDARHRARSTEVVRASGLVDLHRHARRPRPSFLARVDRARRRRAGRAVRRDAACCRRRSRRAWPPRWTPLARESGVAVEPGATSLEDVFIHFMAAGERRRRGRGAEAVMIAFLLAQPRRDPRQGIHPDAARPRHLRDDARHSDPAADPVRLRHQHRSQAARRGVAGDRPDPLFTRADRRGARSQQLLPLRRAAEHDGRGGETGRRRRGLVRRRHSRAISARASSAATSRKFSSSPTPPIRRRRAARSLRSTRWRSARCCASRAAKRRPRKLQADALTITVHRRYNPAGVSQYNIVPGLLGVILQMTMVMMTSIALTRELERGTMENLLAMPANGAEIMLGKVLPYFVVGAVQVVVILAAARLLFHVPFVGSLPLLLAAILDLRLRAGAARLHDLDFRAHADAGDAAHFLLLLAVDPAFRASCSRFTACRSGRRMSARSSRSRISCGSCGR